MPFFLVAGLSLARLAYIARPASFPSASADLETSVAAHPRSCWRRRNLTSTRAPVSCPGNRRHLPLFALSNSHSHLSVA